MRLIGHRGARGEAPENTLSGFRYLRALGVTAVELDIQLSADLELVVIHDPDLERCSNGRGAVRQQRAAALAALDAVHKHFPDWPETEGIPGLREVMTELRDFQHVQFEVKARSAEDCRLIAERFIPLWREFGFAERAYTTSFNPLYLQLIQQQAPEIPRGLLFEQDFHGDALGLAQALGCRSLGPHQARCDAALVEAAHAQGLRVSTWTVNDSGRMQELAALGIDSLITDYPKRALAEVGALFS